MVSKNDTASASELPSYLGLGKLEPNTVQWVNDNLIASYLQDGDLVYKVHIKSDQTHLEEYYQNQVIAQTFGKTLEQTFLQHFGGLETYQHPRFRDLFQPLMQQGNIYINLPNRFTTIFYPAGLILGLRIPLDLAKKEKWNQIRPSFQAKESAPRLDSDNQGFLFYLTDSGNVKGDQILILEFTAMLLEIGEATRRLIKTGLIGKSKEKRMVITDNTQIGKDAFSIYLGDRSKGILTYAFVQLPPKTKPDITAKKFFDFSVQFLDMLKK